MTVHAEIDSGQTVTTTTETVILTAQTFESYGGSGGGYAGGEPAQPIPAVVFCEVNFTLGTAATAIVVRVRHGVNSLVGAIVGSQTFTAAAGSSIEVSEEFLDAVGDLNGYTITVQQTAATGNGTCNNVAMDINPQ